MTLAPGIDDLARRLLAGERRALARAITLAESDRRDHRAAAAQLLESAKGHGERALRLGLSGAPGVGKSTFVESFGTLLTGRGMKIAVLAVDPSSARTGGSILGDKTRMERLSRDPGAFIRPSPSRTHLGGASRRTREAAALCAAAGYDPILIETVGVGQSETEVAEMTDAFVLLVAPAGGDELQGVKRGIVEVADLILVNKADGEFERAATRTCADYAGALGLLPRRAQDLEGFPKALAVSAATGAGLERAWKEIESLAAWRSSRPDWSVRRAEQARRWFEDEVRMGLLARLEEDPEARDAMRRLAAEVEAGRRAPVAAAEELLANLWRRESGRDP